MLDGQQMATSRRTTVPGVTHYVDVENELIIYNRTTGCPYSTIAKMILDREQVPYREIFIDLDERAAKRVLKWTGYRVVPTLVVSKPGSLSPIEEPQSLSKGKSPRGMDRGFMISEPNPQQLDNWLKKHALL